jgi:ketosteroid isomerase-like protein
VAQQIEPRNIDAADEVRKDPVRDPLATVEAFGAAWANHDLDAAMALVTEDCLFDATGPAPDGFSHVGPMAVAKAWQAIFEDTSSQFEAEETFGAGDRVVQRWRYTWNGGHIRGVDIFKVRDGKVAEKLAYVKG